MPGIFLDDPADPPGDFAADAFNGLKFLGAGRKAPFNAGFFTTDAFTDYVCEFIQERQGSDQPCFLYLAYNAPHWPLHARPETIEKYSGKYRAGWDKLRAERYERLTDSGIVGPQWAIAPRPEALPAWNELSPEKQDTWDEWMSVYAAQVEEVDVGIGRLMSPGQRSRKKTDARNRGSCW